MNTNYSLGAKEAVISILASPVLTILITSQVNAVRQRRMGLMKTDEGIFGGAFAWG